MADDLMTAQHLIQHRSRPNLPQLCCRNWCHLFRACPDSYHFPLHPQPPRHTHASVSYDALFSHSLYSGWGHTRRCTELRLCMRSVNATPLSKSWKTFSFSRIVPCFLYGLIKYGGTTFAKMFCMFSSTIPTRVTNILYILLFMAVVTYWRKARMILLTWIWTFL